MRVYVGSRQIAQYPNNQSRLFRAAMTDLLKAVSVHPTAMLIKRLQFARETRDWKDRVGVSEIIYITGPNQRECRLGDDQRPVLFPVDTTLRVVNSWWPGTFHCRRDSIGDEFRDYWDYQPHEDDVTYRRE